MYAVSRNEKEAVSDDRPRSGTGSREFPLWTNLQDIDDVIADLEKGFADVKETGLTPHIFQKGEAGGSQSSGFIADYIRESRI